jgi:predicted HicB family RNase H-like nuclease
VFFGKIAGIRDVVTFEGDSLTELKEAFEGAVDDYIHICNLRQGPDKVF